MCRRCAALDVHAVRPQLLEGVCACWAVHADDDACVHEDRQRHQRGGRYELFAALSFSLAVSLLSPFRVLMMQQRASGRTAQWILRLAHKLKRRSIKIQHMIKKERGASYSLHARVHALAKLAEPARRKLHGTALAGDAAAAGDSAIRDRLFFADHTDRVRLLRPRTFLLAGVGLAIAHGCKMADCICADLNNRESMHLKDRRGHGRGALQGSLPLCFCFSSYYFRPEP